MTQARWNESFERMRARIHQRAFAYRAVFLVTQPPGRGRVDTTPWWAFWRRPQADELNPAGEIVLRDLARYCHARDTSFRFSPVTRQSDALATAFAEGQRDVFNRIVGLMNLSTEQIERIALARTTDE